MIVERVQVVTMKNDEEFKGIIYEIERKLCESLQSNFTESDADHDGDLIREEFKAALENPEVVKKLGTIFTFWTILNQISIFAWFHHWIVKT